MSVLGENIKKYRLQKGLTQEQLASKLGKTKNVIYNWESGLNKPDANMLEYLCGILEVDANTILGWNDTRQMKLDADALADEILSNPKTKDLLNKIKELPEGDLDMIINFIKRIEGK